MSALWPRKDEDDGLLPGDVFTRSYLSSVEAHTEYQARPEDWMVERMAIPRETIRWSLNPGYERHVWDGTPDPLVAMLDGLARWEDVGVEAATGTQKSYTAALAILWFLASFKHSLVNTYAPKEDQLRLYIWKEIAELWPRFKAMFPSAELTDLRIRVDGTDKWSAHGIATQLRAGEDSATKAQGAHAEHMLLVTEETPGIDPSIMTALRNTRTGAHNIQLSLGNPDNMQDALHSFCLLPDTRHVRISALDHPNVVTGKNIVPGAASPAGIRRIAAKDAPGTPMYESRVRGISPAESTDSLIKLQWIRDAAGRYAGLLREGGRPALGVDAANSEKGDQASIARGVGPCLVEVESKPCPDSNKLGSEVFDEANARGIDPSHIGVDPIGVGAGTVNEMARRGMEPRRLGGSLSPINGAERAPDGSPMDFVADANLFLNLRSQMAWQLREDLRKGELGINPQLLAVLEPQMTVWRYEPRNGKVVVDGKDKAIQRLGFSPNEFDAVMYWNWVRPRAGVQYGKEYGDHEHPGIDIKSRLRKRKTDRSNVPGEDDLERPGHYAVPVSAMWRAPRPSTDDDDTESSGW